MDLAGGCACGALRYRLHGPPLIVHACHCCDCQRITGSAFVINLWIERERVESSSPEPRSFALTGGSGKTHEVFFCGACGTYVWSRYRGAPGDTRFVRGGTLDDPSAVRPDVHIFTRSKLPWLSLPSDVPAFPDYYDHAKVWSPESQERYRKHIAKHAEGAAR